MSTDDTAATPLLPITLIAVDAELTSVAIARNWGWILCVGIINMTAGFFALVAPITATSFILHFVSAVLLFAGGASMTGLCFAEDGMKTQSFILGITKAILGLVLWFYPLESLMTITIIIAIVFMLNGVFLCSVALKSRESPTWGWLFVNGLSAIILSTIVMSAFPTSSLYTLGILVGVNLVTIGMARIAIGIQGHKEAIRYIEAETSAGASA